MHFRHEVIEEEPGMLERLRVMLHRHAPKPHPDAAELDRLRAGMGHRRTGDEARPIAPAEPPAEQLARHDV